MATSKPAVKAPAAAVPAPKTVQLKDLKLAPHKLRPSKYDPISRVLHDGKQGEAVVYDVPKGKDVGKYRSQVYTAMQQSLKKLYPSKTFTVSIAMLETGQLAISLKR